MKTCTKCKIEKPANTEYFYKEKRLKDGLTSTCKECEKKRNQKYYQENREKKLEYNRNHYQENKEYHSEYYQENREKILEYGSNHYQENKEYYSEFMKKYYQENKEKHKEYTIAYRFENPEVRRLNKQRRRARIAQLPHTLTVEEWYETLEYFNNECAYCGDSECNLEQEHVIPVVKGGGYTQENIIPACGTCNSSKNARDLEEWYVSYRHYDEERLNKILDYVEVIKGSVILRVRGKKRLQC